MITVDELRARVDDHFDQTLEDLKALVRIPSVSASSFDQSTVQASAEKVAELFAAAGVETRVTSVACDDGTPGRPAVLGTRQGSDGGPTVMLYAHHDVQPPGPDSDWDQEDPFEPVERDGRLYGRGTSDDKAGVIAHLGAIRALGDELTAGLRLYVEGEEEVGSPSFVNFLREHHTDLASDVAIVLDSSNWTPDVPSLTTTLRGVVQVFVDLRVTDHKLHSGMFGGPILDAPTLMCRLIATLHDDEGNVAVPGLIAYDDSQLDYPEEQFRTDSGLLDSVRLAGSGSLASRLWTKPALSVIGFDSTSVDKRSNTIQDTCRACLSLRIAPGQDPKEAYEALRTFVEESAPFGAEVVVSESELGPAFKGVTDTEVANTARWALETAWGTESVDIGVGGSIPFIADLQAEFPEAEVLVTGIEDPDSRAHSGNESQHIGELRNAILAEALLLAKLSGTLRED